MAEVGGTRNRANAICSRISLVGNGQMLNSQMGTHQEYKGSSGNVPLDWIRLLCGVTVDVWALSYWSSCAELMSQFVSFCKLPSGGCSRATISQMLINCHGLNTMVSRITLQISQGPQPTPTGDNLSICRCAARWWASHGKR